MPCCGRPMTIGVAATDDPGRLRVRCPCGTAWTVLDLLDGDDESGDSGPTDDDDGAPTDDDRSFPVAPSRRARPYAGAPTPRTPAPATAPRQVPAVAAAIGASGAWSCGHQAVIASAVTARDPRASRCRECGAVGLVRQLTADGWAPLILDAPQRPDRTAKRPGRVVAPARFAGAVSPSQAAGPGYWQPVEDRRPGAAERVPVPRYAGAPGPIPPMQGVTTAAYPLP